MAKKKRKKVVKEKYQFSGQLWGIVLILIAVLGIGKLGIVGRFIASFGLFVAGSVYMVFLAAILLIGIYFLFTKKYYYGNFFLYNNIIPVNYCQ